MKQEDFDKLVSNLKTQSNRSTGDPLFCVETKRRIGGIDPDYHDGNYEWYDPGEGDSVGNDDGLKEHLIENGDDLIDGLKELTSFKEFDFPEELDEEGLDALLSKAGVNLDCDDEINLGYFKFRKGYYIDRYEFVTAHFTEAAALQYITNNRHNLNEPRTFVTSQYRCYEWNALREALISGELVLKIPKDEVSDEN